MSNYLTISSQPTMFFKGEKSREKRVRPVYWLSIGRLLGKTLLLFRNTWKRRVNWKKKVMRLFRGYVGVKKSIGKPSALTLYDSLLPAKVDTFTDLKKCLTRLENFEDLNSLIRTSVVLWDISGFLYKYLILFCILEN